MIQLYTGEGKGKTTASVGLSCRASEHFKVLFAQVIKDGTSSEISVLERLPSVTVKTFGQGKRIFIEKENILEKENTERALDFLAKNYTKFDVIVVDELLTAVNLGLISEDKVIDILDEISEGREVVLTGRGATEKLIKKADLVTEMKKVKHYYDLGVKARKGIEL